MHFYGVYLIFVLSLLLGVKTVLVADVALAGPVFEEEFIRT